MSEKMAAVREVLLSPKDEVSTNPEEEADDNVGFSTPIAKPADIDVKWDPMSSLAPRKPIGSGVDIEYESGIATVRIAGSPTAMRRKEALEQNGKEAISKSDSSSPPSTPTDPLPTTSVPTTVHIVDGKTDLDTSPQPSPSPPDSPVSLYPTTSVPLTYRKGKLKQPVSESKHKQPPEMDNVSIISDIPSEPNSSIAGTMRGYKSSLSPISETSTQKHEETELEEKNNNVAKKGPTKKVSWNESVIITTTDSENVTLAGLPYESDTGSEGSSTRSSINNSYGSSPTGTISSIAFQPAFTHAQVSVQSISNPFHPPASRVYPINRTRLQRQRAVPIAYEFEQAQQSPPIMPMTQLAPTGQQQPIVDELEVVQLSRLLASRQSMDNANRDGENNKPKHKYGGCVCVAVVLIVLALVGLLSVGILYAMK